MAFSGFWANLVLFANDCARLRAVLFEPRSRATGAQPRAGAWGSDQWRGIAHGGLERSCQNRRPSLPSRTITTPPGEGFGGSWSQRTPQVPYWKGGRSDATFLKRR